MANDEPRWLHIGIDDDDAIKLLERLAKSASLRKALERNPRKVLLKTFHIDFPSAPRPVSRDELDVLLALPSRDWAAGDGLRPEVLKALAERGLVVTDESSSGGAFDERLRDSGWNLYAAVYHFLTRWRGVDIRDEEGELVPAGEDDVRAFLAAHGTPPPAFFELEAPARKVELPLVEASGELYETLARRRTTRGFDAARPLPL